jgi:hypothetical protein
MTMHAGTVAHFGGSMAEAIDQAFAAELLALKGTPLPDASKDERQMLFAAIAQGVLAYLHANQSDLTIVIGPATYQLQINFVKQGA